MTPLLRLFKQWRHRHRKDPALARNTQQCLQDLHAHEGRSIVLYYSSFMDKPANEFDATLLAQEDVDSIIKVCADLPTDKLDLILHSPGGNVHAADELANYLARTFTSFRVVVPRIAMSSASMLACAANEILMANHSFLGPTDIQVPSPDSINEYVSSQVVFERMRILMTIMNRKDTLQYWEKHGDYLIQVKHFIHLGEEMLAGWLNEYMYEGNPDTNLDLDELAHWLSDVSTHKVHERRLNSALLREKGLKVRFMEENRAYYDLAMKCYFAAKEEANNGHIAKIISSHAGKKVYDITK